MLAGAYPSDEFAELKPRVVWDRVTDTIEGRRDARVVAVTSGGTIPDRGLFGVFMAGEAGTRRPSGRRARRGDGLRAPGRDARRRHHPRREQLAGRRDRPRPGDGDAGPGRARQAAVLEGRRGRPAGRARPGDGRVRRRARGGPRPGREGPGRRHDPPARDARPRRAGGRQPAGLPRRRARGGGRAADRQADRRRALPRRAGRLAAVPADPVRRPGPRSRGRWPSRRGSASGWGWRSRRSGRTTASRSGCPRATPRSMASRRCCSRSPTRSRISSSGTLATSAMFASRFRENAARALLLPRRRPGTRTPLWQQRQRSADLLAVASRYGSFPILVETYRECLSDVFDLPALREILAGVARRDIAIHGVETVRASPFAASLMFDYVAAYMYDGDTPIAERRAGALTLDRDLLRELLGQEELRELLDPDALADLELSLQALTDDRQATTLDGVHDLLRRLGDLSTAEVAARTEGGLAAAVPWLDELAAARRAVRDPDRGRRALAGHRGRRPLSRRGRDLAAGRRPGRLPRAGGGRARRPAGPLGPDPRPVPDTRARPALGPADRCRRGCPRAAARRRLDAARRVPAGRCRARMVRPGGPAPPPPPVAGAAAPRGRAGRSGGARAVPARLAGRRPGRAEPAAAARHGRPRAARRGGRPAGRAADPGLGPGAGRAAGADPGLPAATARRARRPRRGRLGGAGEPRPRRRPDRARAARA